MSKFATVNTFTYDDGKIDSDIFISTITTNSLAEKVRIISEEISRFKMLDYDDSAYAKGYLDNLEVTYETAQQYGV